MVADDEAGSAVGLGREELDLGTGRGSGESGKIVGGFGFQIGAVNMKGMVMVTPKIGSAVRATEVGSGDELDLGGLEDEFEAAIAVEVAGQFSAEADPVAGMIRNSELMQPTEIWVEDVEEPAAVAGVECELTVTGKIGDDETAEFGVDFVTGQFIPLRIELEDPALYGEQTVALAMCRNHRNQRESRGMPANRRAR